jgi:hypothetical protein
MPHPDVCANCKMLYAGREPAMIAKYGYKTPPKTEDRAVSVCMAPFDCRDSDECGFFLVRETMEVET